MDTKEDDDDEDTCKSASPGLASPVDHESKGTVNKDIIVTTPKDRDMSQKSLAQYVLDNNEVTHVPECDAYIVNGHQDKKYCVTLRPETCQCPSSSRCYHVIAVKMFMGLAVNQDSRDICLRSLSKRSLKRSDKKSGGKNQEWMMLM